MTDPGRFFRATLLVLLCALVLYITGNADVPLFDRDEPRYAQCSRQMFETGDWVLPRLLDELRMAKPPLIYWLQASCMTVFGDTAFAARLPSGIAMAATLLLVAIAVRRSFGAEHAFWAVLVMASSVMTIIAAKSCLTDAVLVLFITIAQLCVYAMWRGTRSWWPAIGLGLAIGLALLTKGPVVLGVLITTLIALAILKWTLRFGKAARDEADSVSNGISGQSTPVSERTREDPDFSSESGSSRSTAQTRRAFPQDSNPDSNTKMPWGGFLARSLVVVGLIAAVGIPWMILVEQRWAELPQAERERAAGRGDRRKSDEKKPEAQKDEPALVVSARKGELGYVATVLTLEVLDRSARGHEGHSGPPGYYLATIWPTFLPWSLILPATMALAWKRRREPRIRFALAAVVGPWIMFEAVATKLPHYVLPCVAPLAVLCADAIVRCLREGAGAMSSKAFGRGVIVWGAFLLLFGLAPFLLALKFQPLPWGPMVVLAVVTIGYAMAVVVRFRQNQTQSALTLMGVGAFLLFAVVFRVFLPACDFLRLSEKTAAVLRAEGATTPGSVVMLDYKEPSLGFYQGGSIREHSATLVTQRLLDTVPAEWFVITKNVWDNSAPRVPGQPDPRDRLKIVASFHGLDVADEMRDVVVMVTRRIKPGEPATQPATSPATKPAEESK